MINLLPVAMLAATLSAQETDPASTPGQVTLDLRAVHSEQELHQQIRSAAEQVCLRENRYAAHLPRVQRNCVRDTVARALDQVRASGLTQTAASEPSAGLPEDADLSSNALD